MENSPFQKLSPELRNRICELALSLERPIAITADGYHDKLHTTTECAKLKPMALATVCKQIRSECIHIFFASNTFVVKSFNLGLSEYECDKAGLLQRWTSEFSKSSAASIRKVVVVIIERASYACYERPRASNLVHQLRSLQSFATAHPACQVLRRFSWTDEICKNRGLYHLPLVGFNIEDGWSALLDATNGLEHKITLPEENHGLFRALYSQELFSMLRYVMKKLEMKKIIGCNTTEAPVGDIFRVSRQGAL